MIVSHVCDGDFFESLHCQVEEKGVKKKKKVFTVGGQQSLNFSVDTARTKKITLRTLQRRISLQIFGSLARNQVRFPKKNKIKLI